MSGREIAKIREVAGSLQLALLLEVSAYPKPGNVHRTADFDATRYEHFLASAVAVRQSFLAAADRGMNAIITRKDLGRLSVGRLILDSVSACNQWQRGGNTSLGSIILLVPMAMAAGMVLARRSMTPRALRGSIKRVVMSTTWRDSVALYEAIRASCAGGLGYSSDLNVFSPESTKIIRRKKLRLIDIFRLSAERDSICEEWVKGYPITFELTYPYLVQQIEETSDINAATVNAFLMTLSRVPDTLIARKAGFAKAREISREAGEVLLKGGLVTDEGRKAIEAFDRSLRANGHRYNPGTTADIVTSALSVAILSGYRP